MSTLASVSVYGLIADRPSPSIPGRIYYASDTGNVYYDTGSAWEAVATSGGGGGGGGPTLTPPVEANWSNLNTGGMSLVPTYQDSSYWEMGSAASGTAWEGLSTALPTPPYTATFRVFGNPGSGSGGAYGGWLCGWGDGTGHLCLNLQINVAGGNLWVNVVYWATSSAQTGNPSGFPPTGLDSQTTIAPGVPTWVQLIDDGTNWTIQWSQEAFPTKWIVAWTGPRNTDITATQLEVGVNSGGSSRIIHLIFDSYVA
jgi:hypothetical protein